MMGLTVSPAEWIDQFVPFGEQPVSADPLAFPGYEAQLERARERSQGEESVVCGTASAFGFPVVVIDFRFAFMGGSMGEATGRRIAAAVDRARTERIPLLSLVASGGARMQEGMRSLIQMQVCAGALARLRRDGVPHIAVLRSPTTGGIWASFASLADVAIAERGATVSFAGPRVRAAVGTEGDADTTAFTAGGKYESGAIDRVLDPEEIADEVRGWLRVLAVPRRPLTPVAPPSALPGADVPVTGWDAVQRARRPEHPRAEAYLDDYFDERVEISGDRIGGRDGGMLCGIGLRDGVPIAFAAQTGTGNSPAGFRTVQRLLTLATRWSLPVLTLVDTPGAQNDAAAERANLGTAIADTFVAIAEAAVPVTSLLVGEGGSGGALAIAAPDNLWAVPSSYFSVIAPEGAAAILYRDAERAAEVAEVHGLAPVDLERLGIIRGVVGASSSTASRRGVAV